ncbi:MAG: hypothetical protein ACOYB8_10120 [Eubacteriaceae bacterium]|jgi:hypothetical protein
MNRFASYESTDRFTPLLTLEWDLSQDTFDCSDLCNRYRISTMDMKHLYTNRRKLVGVRESDRAETVHFIEDICSGAVYKILVTRLLTDEDNYRWTRVTAKTSCNSRGEVDKIQCTVMDIDYIFEETDPKPHITAKAVHA